MDVSNVSKKKEDEYFARLEFERLKKQLEEQDARMEEEERENLKDLHWMRCPKCGHEMVEIDFKGIILDKCSHCLGIYFDNGELEDLLSKKAGFMTKMFKIFKD